MLARETLERKGDDPRVHCRQWEPHDEMEQRRERTGIGEQPCREDARVPPRQAEASSPHAKGKETGWVVC